MRRVFVVAVDDAQSLDVLGPIEVLHSAATHSPEAGYRIEVVAPGGGPVRFSNGVSIDAAPLPEPPPLPA